MTGFLRSGPDMISNMSPELVPGEFVFVTCSDRPVDAVLVSAAKASFREAEGLSLILAVDLAQQASFDVSHPMRCITLNVYSALDGVGLTAAVATALAGAGIPCNMVAAHHHDHVFVPSALAEKAMGILVAMQRHSQP